MAGAMAGDGAIALLPHTHKAAISVVHRALNMHWDVSIVWGGSGERLDALVARRLGELRRLGVGLEKRLVPAAAAAAHTPCSVA